jgi:hypothetical protein
MPVSVGEYAVEEAGAVPPPRPEAPAPAAPAAPDMERIEMALRRARERLHRLWAD